MASRPWMKVLLGTSPGLERLLLASVPALVVGAICLVNFGGWIALAAGFATLAIIIALSRGMSA